MSDRMLLRSGSLPFRGGPKEIGKMARAMTRSLLAATPLLACAGCQILGSTFGAGGLLVDALLTLAIFLAPFALSYYLWKRSAD